MSYVEDYLEEALEDCHKALEKPLIGVAAVFVDTEGKIEVYVGGFVLTIPLTVMRELREELLRCL